MGQVELEDGTVLQADIAIVGIGSTFYTDWLKDSALELTSNGSVIVDKVTYSRFNFFFLSEKLSFYYPNKLVQNYQKSEDLFSKCRTLSFV